MENGVDMIFRIAAIGIITAVVNMLLARSGREELGLMATLAALVVVMMMVIGEVATLFATIKQLFGL